MPAGLVSLLLRFINMDKPAGRGFIGNRVFRVGLELTVVDNFRDNISNQGRHAVWAKLSAGAWESRQGLTLDAEEKDCGTQVLNLKDTLHVLAVFCSIGRHWQQLNEHKDG